MPDPNHNQPKPPAPDYATRPDVYRNPPEIHEVTLSPEDAAAVDSMLDRAEVVEDVAVEPARVERAQEWLNALSMHRVEQPPMNLLERTLQAVESDPLVKIGASVQMPAPTVRARSHAFSRRLVEYAAMAIAASVLLMVLIPGIGQARDKAKQMACADNLRIMGGAFDAFGRANSNELPSLASPMGASWKAMKPEDATLAEHSNTANLLPLVRSGYLTEPKRFACPAVDVGMPAGWTAAENDVPDSFRGYSYVDMFAPAKPKWGEKEPARIVLADRNPIFSPNGCKDLNANSPNHGGKGSMVLYTDNSARWQTSPNVGPNGDNIWTVASKLSVDVASYKFNEVPADVNDVFLVP